MKRADVHRAWAPADGTWTAWVKPVVFTAIDDDALDREEQREREQPRLELVWRDLERQLVEPLRQSVPERSYRDSNAEALSDVAVVVDMPGAEAIHVGVALAEHGFRPVPLYNAVPLSKAGVSRSVSDDGAARALVDLAPLVDALIAFAPRVAKARVNGAPVFLLDANRMGGKNVALPGMFDNRSICRASDFPSVESLTAAGIKRVLLLVDRELEPDLESIAYAWQEKGLALWRSRRAVDDENEQAAPFALRRRWFGARWLAALRQSTLRQSGRTDGAYGVMIEESASG